MFIIIMPWGGADIGPIGTLLFMGPDMDMGGILLLALTEHGGSGGGPLLPTLGGPWFELSPGGALPGPPPLLRGPTGVPEPLPCVEPWGLLEPGPVLMVMPPCWLVGVIGLCMGPIT